MYAKFFETTPTFNEPRPLLITYICPLNPQSHPKEPLALSYYNTIGVGLYHTPQLTLVVYSRLFIAEAMFRVYREPPVGLRPIMYYTACLLLTIQWQLLCQAIVYKWEGLLKIVWGGGGLQPPEPPLDPPLYAIIILLWC